VFQTIQGGIEGTLLDLKLVSGDLLNAEQDAIPVLRAEGNRLQYEEIQRALE
jgi:hypothetical protein